MARKTILYISFYFPPLGGIAALRAAKTIKYLSAEIEPVVLCASPQGMRHPQDVSLLDEYPASTHIHRVCYPDLSWIFKVLWGLKLHRIVDFISQRLLIPGPEKLWLPFARRAIDKILRSRTDISLAYISSGPPAALLLGRYLLEKHGVPYVCEFRDEWTNNPERINATYSTKAQQREQILERRVLRSCLACVYLTEQMRNNFVAAHPFLRDKPSLVIPNGFDTEDFHGLASGAPNPKFTLTYTGSFYDRRQPEALWKALRHLCQTGKIDPADVHIAIIGRNTPAFVLGEYEKDPLILSMLHFTGFIQHRESLRQMLNADALLLYIPSGQNTESILTGKIFDYLFSEKPVLAIVPPMGEAARLLTGAGIGFIADHTDIAGIECRITELYDLWKCGELAELKADASFIGGYSRKLLATRLSAFLLSLPEP